MPIVGGKLKKVHAFSTGQDPEVADDSEFLPIQNIPEVEAPRTPDTEVDLPIDTPALQDLHSSLSNTDPEQNAKVLTLADKTGEPASFVHANLPQVEKAVTAPPVSFFATLENQYPGTTKWLSKPNNMAVAHDDLPATAEHESLFQKIQSAWDFEKHAFQSGALQEELAFTRYQQLSSDKEKSVADLIAERKAPVQTESDPFRLGGRVATDLGVTSTDAETRAQQISGKLAELEKGKPKSGESWLKRGIYGATEFIPQIAGGLLSGVKYAAPAAVGGGLAGAMGGPITASAGAAAGSAVGMTAGEIEYNYKLMSGLSYDSLLKVRDVNGNPLPENVTKIAAQAIGAATAGLSLLKVGAVIETIPGGKEFMQKFTAQAGEKVLSNPATMNAALSQFAKNYVTATVHGVAAMEGITVAGIAGERGAELASGQKFDHSQDPSIGSQILDTAGSAALTFGVLGFPGSAIGLARDTRMALRAEQGRDFVTALAEKSQESKLRERMPEAHQELIGQLAKDSPVETIHIPVEAMTEYFQGKGIDTATAVKELGISESYDEAKATGGDVQIPLEVFNAKLGGTEHLAGLINDIKFDPEDLTVNEVKKRQTEIDKQTKALQSEQESQPELGAESAQKIHGDISTQLKAAGRSKEEAEYTAQIITARLETLAKQLGVDPYELYQRNRIRVGKGGAITSPEAHVLEQSARIDGTNVIDASSMFAKKAEEQGTEPKPSEKVSDRLDRFKARFGGDKKTKTIEKAIDKAQDPNQGPYVKSKSIPGIGWAPNYAAEPTGVIGPDRIAEPHSKGKEMDPLGWHDHKFSVTKQLIEKHAEQGKSLVLNTSSDLAGHADYVDAYPTDTTVRMHLLTKDEALNRVLFPGNPSRRRQEIAVERLKEYGVKVESISPTADQVIEAAGGVEKIAERLEVSSENVRMRVEAALGSHLKVLEQPPHDSDGPRGRIQFGAEGSDRLFHVDLLKNADRSTFLHETGHYFLEVMGDVASKEGAPESVKEDYATLLKWFGVDSRAGIKEEHHEKFARGFEQYLREGNAPTPALQKAFAKFKDWLVEIYRHMTDLKVELTPEVREVMDRMLASQDEIHRANESVGYKDESIPDATPEAQTRVRDLQARARDAAEGALLKEQMQEVTKQRREFLNSERERLTQIATEAVQSQPLYKAIEELKTGSGKRRNPADMAEQFLVGKLKDEDAGHFEYRAELGGFASGYDLAKQIITARENDSFPKEISQRVADGMAVHADLKSSEAIRAEALKAIHNERMTELLALERQILSDLTHKAEVGQEVSRRRRQEASVEAKAARDSAEKILAAKSIKEAGSFRKYMTAERNAAVKVSKALASKNYEAAAKAKGEQMLSHALASESLRNRTEGEKSLDYLSQFEKRGGDLKNMPYGFIRQVDQLLSRFGLREENPEDTTTLVAIAREMEQKGQTLYDIADATGLKKGVTGQWVPETLPDLVARLNEGYHALILPDGILHGGERPFEDLTLGELRDLKDGVKSIVDAGKGYNRFLGDFKKSDIKEAAKDFKESLESVIGTPYAEKRRIGRSNDSRLKEFAKSLGNITDAFIPSMVNMATLAQYIDGGSDGPFHEYIYRPLKKAEDAKFERHHEMVKQVQALLHRFYTPKELSEYKSKASERYFPGIDRKLNKEEVLTMALNWGNEGNRDRIRNGYHLEDPQIEQILGSLSKKDWDFTQALWDHLDTYWPEIKALEMKVNGVEPGRVEPSEVVTPHGTYRGGYYPIAYDFGRSSEAYKNAEQKNELFKQMSSAAAHTDRGHAQARVSSVSRPVRLSLSVFFNHLENVVHDLTFREAVIDVNRFLRQPDVRGSLENGIGVKPTKSINDWLKAQGSDQSENLGEWAKVFQWTRFSTTLSTLGLTPKALLLHFPSNVFNSWQEIGAMRTASMLTQSMMDHVMGKSDLKEFVFGNSVRMKQRLTIRDRDIMEMSKKWEGKAAGVIPQYAFMLIHFADEAVSIPLWADVYRANLEEHGEVKARDIADETVTRTLGSGSVVDRIGAQRGNEGHKLFTMFYSWMSVMFNRAWLEGKIAGLEYKQGNVGKAAAIIAKATFFAWLLPAAHEALLAEAMRNAPQGTDDERAKRMAGKFIEHPFAMMLIARDIVPPLIHRALGERAGSGDQYRMSPVEMALQNLIAPAGDAVHIAFSDKQADERFAEEVARGISQLTGTPQQINAWAFNLFDYAQGNGEATWQDFLSRRRKK